MFKSALRVKYVNFKSCFVYMNPLGKYINTGSYVQLDYDNNKTAYFSINVIQSIVEVDCLGINSAFAKALDIKEDDYVTITQIYTLPILKTIDIQPFHQSDYEILELLANNVQSNLLDQLRVVNVGQKFIIWIGSSISVAVLVSKAIPVSLGVLDFLTEVVIKPPSDDVKYIKNSSVSKQPVIKNENLLNFFTINNCPEPNEQFNQIQNELRQNKELIYRLVPLTELPGTRKQSSTIFDVFKVYILRADQFDEFFKIKSSQTEKFFTMSLLNSTNEQQKRLHVEICFLEDLFTDISTILKEINTFDNIFISDSLFHFMQCDLGAKVLLKHIETIPRIKEIEVKHGRSFSNKKLLEKLKSFLITEDNEARILNANFPMKIDNELCCSFQFLPDFSEFCICTNQFIKSCSFNLLDEQFVKFDEEIYKEIKISENYLRELTSIKNVCNNIKFTLFKQNHCFHAENIIVTGNAGMGKSTILNFISYILRRYPYFIYSQTINCKTIKGKAADSLQKLFLETFSKLIFYQPSLLILDDIHVLCEFVEGEESPNTVYFNRISSMICNLLSIIPKNNSIGILASATAVSKMNRNLYRSRGNQLFKNVFNIKELDKNDRHLLLEFFLERNFRTENINYKELAIKTDGFVVQDIKDFCQKIIFEACKDSHSDRSPTITPTNCEIAFKKSCSLSLQNVKFHKSTSKSFDEIGGLHKVKEILIETFLWSVKYPTIFANAPLRLQSGLLLYGLPGTGKTLLAGAAAKKCGLRLISVKGPELLSKYIGASEQAVRDVFQKAQTAKPCILFFDEFDSLAPRRGHDNTGVTDRVVNQLLTQLDGIESLTGVCVLAATSRPDLLDPALLRPGRLDKQVLCQMPNKDERSEIMKIFLKNLKLAKDIDYEELASRTDGFTGADLQSVVCTAQMTMFSDIETKILSDDQVITQSTLLDALAKTNPSISMKERLKYTKIYTEFQHGYIEKFLPGSKVTLA